MKNSRDKEVYNSKICTFCKNKSECDKDKFKVYSIDGKTTMRCSNYDYDINNNEMNDIIY